MSAPAPVSKAAPLPELVLVRHGETAWTRSGQYTGLTDLPMTAAGEGEVAWLAGALRGRAFGSVGVSPLQRVWRSCELAGFAARAELDPDLLEWDHGEYEGHTRAGILARRPDWHLFRDGCPGGESPAAIAARADRVIARVRARPGDAIVFSSGHLLRVLAARWVGFGPELGAALSLDTASLSILGYSRSRAVPVIRLWNATRAHWQG